VRRAAWVPPCAPLCLSVLCGVADGCEAAPAHEAAACFEPCMSCPASTLSRSLGYGVPVALPHLTFFLAPPATACSTSTLCSGDRVTSSSSWQLTRGSSSRRVRLFCRGCCEVAAAGLIRRQAGRICVSHGCLRGGGTKGCQTPWLVEFAQPLSSLAQQLACYCLAWDD
jgi:hypothetical protein